MILESKRSKSLNYETLFFFVPSFTVETGFFFFLSPVSRETDNKHDSFLWQFQFQSWIFGQFHETVIWLKCWNCQFGRKKIETAGGGEAACRQFQFFFRPNLTVLTFYANITVSWNLPENFNFDTETVTKTVIFICQFSSETVRQ